ncbi:MAG: hypothetical protein Q8O68_00650 [Candidatus Daviesbacteria bacterium]|nr:hypothetical protein [Candidatus Daviesbacteria bacterium]
MNKYHEIFWKECEQAKITNIQFKKTYEGRAYYDDRSIIIPHIKTAITLATALHEIGHIVIGDQKPSYYNEFLAEMFVQQKFKEHNIPLKRKILYDQKDYVAYCVHLSKKKKGPSSNKIRSEVRKFIKEFENGKKKKNPLENI